jgi:hypothetical protein
MRAVSIKSLAREADPAARRLVLLMPIISKVLRPGREEVWNITHSSFYDCGWWQKSPDKMSGMIAKS